ncbi:hypothetical protein ACFWNK_34085 [Streptomyces sp. NPDC058417]|uniref:hypothetical protein n=1 Tax=unclassified Streptomyces TaxID=2593676 RepID=UPI00365F723B
MIDYDDEHSYDSGAFPSEKSPSDTRLARWLRDSYELPYALAKLVATTLRDWGLLRPDFIDERIAKQATARHPHHWVSYRFVDHQSAHDTVLIGTPDYDTEGCVHCGLPLEGHTFICHLCRMPVPSIDRHTHDPRMRGELKSRGIKRDI